MTIEVKKMVKGDVHDAELLARAQARRAGVVSRRNNPKILGTSGATVNFEGKKTGLKRRNK